MFRVAYTLGRVIDTVPDATAVAPGNVQDDEKYASNPADFEVDRTLGNNDQRHRLVASGVYGIGGWWFSGILHGAVGATVLGAGQRRPQRRRQRAQRSGAWHAAERPTSLPAIIQLDARVARDIPFGGRVRAQLIAEAFNLFNRDNINSVVNLCDTPWLARR